MDSKDLELGLAYLAQVDADLARVLTLHGAPASRQIAPGFGSILRSIVGQQLSVKAAATIWGRLEALADPLTPAAILNASDEVLRGIGLSGQKSRYVKALAADLMEGRIDLDLVAQMDDEAAIATLIKAKGIGRWTAEMYLMFALGRPDIMPVADLGIIVALQHLKGLPERPHAQQLLGIAEPWRPWRSAACLLLWHYRHNMPV